MEVSFRLRRILLECEDLSIDEAKLLSRLIVQAVLVRSQRPSKKKKPNRLLSNELGKAFQELNLVHNFTHAELLLVSIADLHSIGIEEVQTKKVTENLRNLFGWSIQLSNPSVTLRRLIESGRVESFKPSEPITSRSAQGYKHSHMLFPHHLYYHLTPKGHSDASKQISRLKVLAASTPPPKANGEH